MNLSPPLPAPDDQTLAGVRPGPLLRLYLRWAEPWYRRMPPATEDWARRVDLWLYGTRAGRLAALAFSAAIVLTALGLRQSGMPWWIAGGLGLVLWLGLMALLAKPWVQPEGINRRWFLRGAVIAPLLGLSGAVCGALLALVLRDGGLDMAAVAPRLARTMWRATPIVLSIIAAGLLLQWGVAQWRRHQMQQALAQVQQLQLVHERDAAALRMREAELRLLQAQVRPHFIFNTLAAVQHWVDTGDARAAPLLRALTAFLRGATEQLGQSRVRLADEAATVGHYLQIMQARLGERLRSHIDIAPTLADRPLPPGLLLTLVENAVEHGVSPALAGAELRVLARPEADGWSLVVADDGVGLPPGGEPVPEAGRGVGLANCRARLAHHFGDAATLSLADGRPGTVATLRFRDSANAGPAA
ncbi:MAG: histidine kinase [Burkholderiaceae bacterium]|nr:histidine kinase [Burkholderiaceae bacterium]